jgi:hypothetical protein
MSDPNLASLYAGWTEAVPEAFRMLMPGAAAAMPAAPNASAAASGHAGAPFPVAQIGAALGVLEGVLTQLYQAYLPLFAQGKVTAEPFEAMAQTASKAFNAMLLPPQQAPAGLPSADVWPALSASAFPGAAQLQLGIERTFGGLGEAFGLGPARQWQEAWREMLVASVAKQRAQAEYLALAAQAFATGTATLLRELRSMALRGERVESLLAFIRMWAKAIDAPLHDAMQGAAGLAVTAKVIRASTAHRQQVQRLVGVASTALHVPTRDDLGEAFREIQELKRELRRLKRALPAAAQKKLVARKEQAT